MSNVIYVGLGKDMHFGGIAEWAYRMGFWLRKLGFNFHVITNTDIPKPFLGTYNVIKSLTLTRIMSFGNYYMDDLLNYMTSNIRVLVNELYKVPIIITYDPLMAYLLYELLGVKVFWYSHIHEVIYRKPTQTINSQSLINFLCSLLKHALVLTQHKINAEKLGTCSDNIHVVTIPIAPEYIRINPHPEDYIVYTAGFDEFKNPLMVTKIISKLKDFKVYVFAGRKVNYIKGLPNVKVLGNLDRSEYYKMLSHALLSFQCSKVEALSINTMDNGWFHPMILPKREWSQYWEPMLKAGTVDEYINFIKKLYSSEALYDEVLSKQREFIIKNHSQKVFELQWYRALNEYIGQGRKSKIIEEKLNKCVNNITACITWRDYVLGYKYLLAYLNKLNVEVSGWW